MNDGTTRGPEESMGEGKWPALLAALLAGDLDASDVRVVQAFEDDPGRRDEWEQRRWIGDSLDTEGETLRGALGREAPGLDEAAVLGSFREIAASTLSARSFESCSGVESGFFSNHFGTRRSPARPTARVPSAVSTVVSSSESGTSRSTCTPNLNGSRVRTGRWWKR